MLKGPPRPALPTGSATPGMTLGDNSPPAGREVQAPTNAPTTLPVPAPSATPRIATATDPRPILATAEERAPSFARADARVQVDGKEFVLQPIGSGTHYRRLLAPAAKAIPVELTFKADGGDPGPSVLLLAPQGGTFGRGKTTLNLPVPPDRTLRFEFTPNQEAGLYEVVLRRGSQEEILQFWVPTGRDELDRTALR